MGAVAVHRRKYDRAHQLYRQSLTIAAEIGDMYLAARVLEQAARLSATQGAPALAARFGGAAEALRQAIRAPQPPAERVTYREEMATARAAVDDRVWETEWARGRSMAPEEVLAEMD